MTAKIKELNNCQTVQELKTLYKKLVFIYHPDKGGKTEDMQDLNSLYKKLYEILKNTMNKEDKEYTDIKYENSSDFVEFLEKVINFDGLIIEVVGSWYWIENNQIAIDNYFQLTALGCIWSRGQKRLFYCKGMTKKTKTNYKKKSLDDIKSIYGCNKVTVQGTKSLT